MGWIDGLLACHSGADNFHAESTDLPVRQLRHINGFIVAK
jgi:hypothetical protein